MIFRRKLRPSKQIPPTSPAGDADADLHARSADYIEALRRGDYDFVDLGTCAGGGFTIAERQGGRRGLGFDLNPATVRHNIETGLDVALYDICRLEMTTPCVDFAICSHILEHLPDLAAIERVLIHLKQVCRDYLLIAGPVFEDDAYLESKGLKSLQSLMLEHTCKITVGELQFLLNKIGCRDHVVALNTPMDGSDSIWLYDARESPLAGAAVYDASIHLPKAAFSFDRRLFRDFVCIVPLSEDVSCDSILSQYYWGFDKIAVRSSWLYG